MICASLAERSEHGHELHRRAERADRVARERRDRLRALACLQPLPVERGRARARDEPEARQQLRELRALLADDDAELLPDFLRLVLRAALQVLEQLATMVEQVLATRDHVLEGAAGRR